MQFQQNHFVHHFEFLVIHHNSLLSHSELYYKVKNEILK